MENLIMAHRYLYYVVGEPVISDHTYDVLERQARALLPATSPVQGIGSSLPSSYSTDQIDLALDIQAVTEEPSDSVKRTRNLTMMEGG